MADIEKVINDLKARGIKLADIYGRMKLERGYFNGRRRSINEASRRGLAEDIIKEFPEFFQNYEIKSATEQNEIKSVELESLKRENQTLRETIKILESVIKNLTQK